MAVPYLLIDGYNVLHAAGLARATYGPGDLERARHRLLRLLVTYLREGERQRAKVVFDAYDAPADLSRFRRFEGLQVVFAEAGSDADSLIEKMIARHNSPRQIVVVSSDRRLQKAAHRRKAKSVESHTFLNQILHRPEQPKADAPREPNVKYEAELTAGELEEWLDLFGDVSELIEKDAARRSKEQAQAKADQKEAEKAKEETAKAPPESEKDEWADLLNDLGLADELAAEMSRQWEQSHEMSRLQEEINRLIEEQGGSDE